MLDTCLPFYGPAVAGKFHAFGVSWPSAACLPDLGPCDGRQVSSFAFQARSRVSGFAVLLDEIFRLSSIPRWRSLSRFIGRCRGWT